MFGKKKEKVFTPAKTVEEINFNDLQRRITMAFSVRLKTILIRFYKSKEGVMIWIAFSDKSDYVQGYITNRENWIADVKEMLNDIDVGHVELGVSKDNNRTKYAIGYLTTVCKKQIEDRLEENKKLIRLK